MSYSVHQSKGLIVRKSLFKEDSELFYIFTREFGLVVASTIGSRKTKSKLRPFLLAGMINDFDFVESKRGYLLIGAYPFLDSMVRNLRSSLFFERISDFLLQFEKGIPHEVFFDDILNFKRLFSLGKIKNQEQSISLIIYRELIRLGYVPDQNVLKVGNIDFYDAYKMLLEEKISEKDLNLMKLYQQEGLKNFTT